MVRFAWIGVAVVSGAIGALLLVWGPTVEVAGYAVGCPGIVASAEGGGTFDDSRVARKCLAVQRRWTAYAVAAGLVCLVAGTGAAFRRPASTAPDRPTDVVA